MMRTIISQHKMSLLIIAFFIFGSSTMNHENLLSNQIIDKTDDNNAFPNNVYETDLSQLSVEIPEETSETTDINSGAYDYWLIIENETEDSDTRVSVTYIEAAQKFEIVEETLILLKSNSIYNILIFSRTENILKEPFLSLMTLMGNQALHLVRPPWKKDLHPLI